MAISASSAEAIGRRCANTGIVSARKPADTIWRRGHDPALHQHVRRAGGVQPVAGYLKRYGNQHIAHHGERCAATISFAIKGVAKYVAPDAFINVGREHSILE